MPPVGAIGSSLQSSMVGARAAPTTAEAASKAARREQSLALRKPPPAIFRFSHACVFDRGQATKVRVAVSCKAGSVTIGDTTLSLAPFAVTGEKSLDGGVLTPLEPARAAASGIQPTLCVRIFVGTAAIWLSARPTGLGLERVQA